MNRFIVWNKDGQNIRTEGPYPSEGQRTDALRELIQANSLDMFDDVFYQDVDDDGQISNTYVPEVTGVFENGMPCCADALDDLSWHNLGEVVV